METKSIGPGWFFIKLFPSFARHRASRVATLGHASGKVLERAFRTTCRKRWSRWWCEEIYALCSALLSESGQETSIRGSVANAADLHSAAVVQPLRSRVYLNYLDPNPLPGSGWRGKRIHPAVRKACFIEGWPMANLTAFTLQLEA